MSGTNLATAYVQIIPTTKGIQGGIEEALGGDGGGKGPGEAVGKNFSGSFIKTIRNSAIALAIGKTIKDSLGQGGALEQSIGGIETLFGKDAQKVIKNADRAFKTAGISANDYMEQTTSFSASLLSSLGNNTAKASKYADMAIIDMADNANKFGTDIEMIQNAYQGFSRGNFTMLDNLKLGFAGTKEGMQNLLDKASEITGKKYNIDSLADIYSAIHAVQTELGVTGTTAKEGATTLQGSLGMLGASWQNLLGDLALGRNLDKALGDLFSSVGSFAMNLVPMLGNIVKSIPNVLTSINWVDVSKKLMEQAGVWVDAGIEWLGKLGEGMSNGMPGFFAKLPQFMTNIASIINQNAPKLIFAGMKLVANLAIGLVRAIPTILKNLPQIAKAVFDVWTAIGWASLGKSAIIKMGNAFKGGAKNLVASIRSIFSNVVNAIRQPFVNAMTAVRNILSKIKSWFPITIGKIFAGIQVPHFSVKKIKESLKKFGSFEIPEFKTVWNAKGGIVDGATLIGAGEKGAEGIVPLDPFWERMDNTLSAMRASSAGGSGTLTVVFNVDGTPLYEGAVDYINGQTLQFGVSPLKL